MAVVNIREVYPGVSLGLWQMDETVEQLFEAYPLLQAYRSQVEEKYKNEQNLIDGCQSRVWLQCDYVEGHLVFTADSDALITKGIIALLIRVISGHTPKEIMDADLYFIEKIGLRQHLSPTRSNGLLSMVKQIKAYSIAFSTK